MIDFVDNEEYLAWLMFCARRRIMPFNVTGRRLWCRR